MTFELPDGAQIELPDGATGADVAAAIGPGLARAALAIEVGGVMYDLSRPLPHGGRTQIITSRSGQDALDLGARRVASRVHDAPPVVTAFAAQGQPAVRLPVPPRTAAQQGGDGRRATGD